MSQVNSLVEKTFSLSNRMCLAGEVHLVTTVAEIKDDQHTGYKTGWAGGPSGVPSRAPVIGPIKATEVYLHRNDPETLIRTPTTSALDGLSFMGGFGRHVGDYFHIVSSSAWDQQCDAMWSLMLLYAMDSEVRFHHVGFRHPSRQELDDAVAKDCKKFGVAAIEKPLDDHLRVYIPVLDENAPNKIYYREHQYFYPDDPTFQPVFATPAIHWDVVTSDPEALLRFVSKNLGKSPTLFSETDRDDPVGVHWEKNRGDVMYGFMARSRWWTIAD